jgi:hypothetical protein
VEDRPVRLEVETLDVQQPTVTGLHDHRNAVRAGPLADEHLGVCDVEIGIDLEHLPRGEHRLLHPEIGHAGAQAVQVRQVEAVEIRNPE